MATTPSGFYQGLEGLADAGVHYVLVGVGAINFYAEDPAHAFSTLDLDILLAPDVENLRKALRALGDRGFAFEAGGEPFLDLDDEAALGNIVGTGANLGARHENGAWLDLMLSVRGFSYAELATDAREFSIGDRSVWVGRLEKLLRSKELSGRPKDIEFLRIFAAQNRQDEET